MRYESFYPFAGNQSPPPRQQQFGANPFMQPPQNPGQSPQFNMQNNPFTRGGPSQPGAQGPSKVDGYMETANRFLNTAQQFAPVAQQFAPMMRNLPAMWRLYKGFQSMPSAGGAPSTGPAPSNAARATTQNTTAAQGPLPSVPRIFQPPNR